MSRRAPPAARGEPQPLDPQWPRYCATAFPPYRYVPGHSPHPRRDPSGHSRNLPEPIARDWAPDQWPTLEPWLYGVDLFNYAYWWEAHEQLEALWLAAGRASSHARFLQGLIKISAASLNLWLGKITIARGQGEAGVAAMLEAPRSRDGCYMGVAVVEFTTGASRWFDGRSDEQPLIRLASF